MQRFAAVCDPAERDQVNTQLGEVSGNFADIFRLPCYSEGDDVTIQAYSTGIVHVQPTQQAKLVDAATPPLTSADWRSIPDRGPRFPDDYDMFLAHYQLRRLESFVHVTGLIRSSGSRPAQTIDVEANPTLVNQWDFIDNDKGVNSRWSGDGNRLQVDFAGNYRLEATVRWDDSIGVPIHFQLNIDAAPFGQVIDRLNSPLYGVFDDVPLNADSKIGLGVWADSAGVSYHQLGSWLGCKRTS